MKTAKPFLLFLLTIFSLNLMAAELPKYSKAIINEQIKVNSSALLKVKNKYGNISCSNWDQQSVAIKVTVNVEAGSQKEADKILNSVSVKLNYTSSLIEAETKFGSSWGNSKNNYMSVDYQIMMPAAIKVDLDNSFGAITMDEVNDKAIIFSAYGSLTANKFLGNENRINVEFGKGNVNEVKSGNINVKYSNFTLGHGGTIKADFKYSDFEVEKIENLDINIEGGKLKANSISTLIGTTKFTDVKVFVINSSVDISLEYGNVNIIELKPEVSLVDISSKFSGIKIGISPQNTYKLSAKTSFGDFTFPKQIANFTNVEKTPTKSQYEGTLGKGKFITQVSLDAEYGGIKLELINNK